MESLFNGYFIGIAIGLVSWGIYSVVRWFYVYVKHKKRMTEINRIIKESEDSKESSSADSVYRKEGYYWVKLELYGETGFIIAKYITDFNIWVISGHTLFFYDKDFKEIDERQICRS